MIGRHTDMSKWIGCPTVACINDRCDIGCIRREMPPEMVVFIPPKMYEIAEKAGADMRYYRRTELIPIDGTAA